MRVLHKIIFAFVLVAGFSLAVNAQRDDDKKPRKSPPPVITPRQKNPPPDKGKKPGYAFLVEIRTNEERQS